MKSLTENRPLLESSRPAYPAPPVATPNALTHIIGKIHVKKLLLVAGDIAILYSCLFLSLTIRGSKLLGVDAVVAKCDSIHASLCNLVVGFYVVDLYEIALSRNELGF